MAHRNIFTLVAKRTSDAAGSPITFLLAIATVAVWAITGPLFNYSDTWQLAINTGTTIVTFLMVFLIQNAQNRDTHALQIKLDELIRVTKGAHTALLDLEELDDKQLCKIQHAYEQIAAESRKAHHEDPGAIPHVELPGGTKKKTTRKKAKPLRKRST